MSPCLPEPSIIVVLSLSIVIFLARPDRKSTRLNSSHGYISYAVFCLKKKNLLVVEVLERDHAGSLVADDEWDEDHRLGRLPGKHARVPGLDWPRLQFLVEDQRLARLV